MWFHLTRNSLESFNIYVVLSRFGEKRSPGVFFLMQCILVLSLFLMVSCSGKKEVVKTEEAFDAEKSIARATELIEKKEYDEGRKILIEVKNRDLTKKYAPLAQLKLADSYVRDEEYDLAAGEYKKFLEIYPDHQNASYAQYQIAMTYFVQIESPERGYGAAAKALEEFEKLKRMFPRNPYREMIELRIEKCRNTMADYEFLVAEFYFKKGSYSAALGRFQLLATKFPDYKKEPIVLYHVGVCYKKLGNRDKAVEYFNRLVEKYPSDKIVNDAKKELASLSK
jgi:outer membrane protein assembly factor BamD